MPAAPARYFSFSLWPADPGVQMVLEECLAKAYRLGLVELGLACIIKPLDAGLISPSKAPALCDSVRCIPHILRCLSPRPLHAVGQP